MTREVWLRPNRRVLALVIASLTILLIGVGVVIASMQHIAVTVIGGGLIALVLLLMAIALRAMRRPRLAYEDGFLLVQLGSRQPHRVPITLVECFFLGQGPSLLPPAKLAGEKDSPESSTIVVRLAESADAWKHIEVRPSLGLWCDGYITIRGTWCEPINADRMAALNQRLIVAHRALREKQERETA